MLLDRLSAVSSQATVLELSRADTGLDALLPGASSTQLPAEADADELAGGAAAPGEEGGEGQALLGRGATDSGASGSGVSGG